jgi:myo-inositol-1(or 4)-monophosphatase
MDGMTPQICRIAEEAGVLLSARFGKPHRIEGKDGREFLTEVDLESQELIRTRLESSFPGIRFVGEEGAGIDPEPPCWLVDPLDGTANYAHGYPFFSVSIAFVDRDGVASGCVHDPLRRETFSAERGHGAFLAGSRIGVSRLDNLYDSILATGFPYSRTVEDLGFDIRPLIYFLGRARGIRRSGSAALDLSYVACGRIDGFWEEHLRPWDMAAGALIVSEAGGRILGWGKGRWSINSGGVIAAAPGIMDALSEGIP